MKKIMIVVSVIGLFSSSAIAASLQNRDSQSYDIKVKGSSTSSMSINGGTVKNNICSSCKIEVRGVGTVSVSGSDKAVINNGRISVR